MRGEALTIWIKVKPREWFEEYAYKDREGHFWETPELVDIANVIDLDILSPVERDDGTSGNGLPTGVFKADMDKISTYAIFEEDLVIEENIFQIRPKFKPLISWAVDEVDIKDYPEYLI